MKERVHIDDLLDYFEAGIVEKDEIRDAIRGASFKVSQPTLVRAFKLGVLDKKEVRLNLKIQDLGKVEIDHWDRKPAPQHVWATCFAPDAGGWSEAFGGLANQIKAGLGMHWPECSTHKFQETGEYQCDCPVGPARDAFEAKDAHVNRYFDVVVDGRVVGAVPSIASVKRKSFWQPIETAPKDGRELLLMAVVGAISNTVWTGRFRVRDIYEDGQFKKKKEYWTTPWPAMTENDDFMPTHWAEIPPLDE